MDGQLEEPPARHEVRTPSTHSGEGITETSIVEASRVSQALEALSQRTDYIVSLISPDRASEEFRVKIFTFVSRVINVVLPNTLIVPYGSFISKVYIPDSDLDICCYNHNFGEIPLLQKIQEAFTLFSAPGAREKTSGVESKVPPMVKQLVDAHILRDERLEIENIELIVARISLIKCTICGLGVDISAAQPGSLITSLFIELLDNSIGKNHLLKRSFLLIQTWCMYEARILGGYSQMLSSYALRVMVINILVNCKDIHTPFQALYVFLAYYSNIDYWVHIIHPAGLLEKQMHYYDTHQIGEDMGRMNAHISPSYMSMLRSLRRICDGTLYQPEIQNLFYVITSYPLLLQQAKKEEQETEECEADSLHTPSADHSSRPVPHASTSSPTKTSMASPITVKITLPTQKKNIADDKVGVQHTQQNNVLLFSDGPVDNADRVTPVFTSADAASALQHQDKGPATYDTEGDSVTRFWNVEDKRKFSEVSAPANLRQALEITFSAPPARSYIRQEKPISRFSSSTGRRIDKVDYDPISLTGLTNLSRSMLQYCKDKGAFDKMQVTERDALLLFRGFFSTKAFADALPESRTFLSSYISIVDPLQVVNNLGRSVSEPNFLRIIRCFQTAHTVLSNLIHSCMTKNYTVTEALAEYDCFFISTLSLFGEASPTRIRTIISNVPILSVDVKTLEAGCHLIGATMLGFPITPASTLVGCLQTNHDRLASEEAD